jgi:hypothetical protein
MALELNTLAAQKLEAYTTTHGMTPSEAILSLLELADIETAFDRLEEVSEQADDVVAVLSVDAVQAYRRR